MYLKISAKRRGSRTYQYAQVVEGFRRPDGVPTHRVIANLGQLSDLEIANLRQALRASREQRALVLPPAVQTDEWHARVGANLRYLDVAAALETWRRWKLPRLFNRLIPQGLDAVPASSVIAALVIQRCIDPGSKLYAQRWFPRTALPELLAVEPAQFNNSRIHRVLAQLDEANDALQDDLPRRYQLRDGAFATIFMDVTDAWFEGRGPEMAERDRTKEGFKNHRKVGVVLVCNQHGFPLRWKTVPGKRRDPQCLGDMLSMIQDEPWVGETPLVCDRAMGNAKSIAKLVESGVRFLTATTRPEIPSFTDDLPCEPFHELSPVGSDLTITGEIHAATRAAAAAGLEQVDDTLFFLDLGVRERVLNFERPTLDYSGATWDPNELEGGASFIALARIFQERLDMKIHRNRSELAEREGLTRARVTQIMNTLRLHDHLQERVLRGEFGYVPERLLRDCAKLEGETEQRQLLEEHAKRVRPVRRTSPPGPPRRVGRHKSSLRLVAYFNPKMFVEQRAAISRRRHRVHSFVDDLNRHLRTTGRTRTKESIRREVHQEIARWKLLSVLESTVLPRVDRESREKYWKVVLRFDEREWARRTRHAGFVLLVGHPDLPHTGEELVRLYRQKDTVEKSFQTIKDTVKLRPFYHHTDPKVRAHVTLCMLALLLERTIERMLGRSNLTELRTAPACFEELRGCHLNLVHADPSLGPTYVATEASETQTALLRSLRMKGLIDPEELGERIQPRSGI